MKKVIFLSLVLLALFINKQSTACSPVLVPTLVSQAINMGNLELSWASNTTYNCQYYVDVEIVCNGYTFNGNGNPPFIASATISKTYTPFPYPLQIINLTNFCAGTVYQFRAREVEFGNSAIFSPWTATFTFTTAGVFVQPTATATANPYLICVPGNSQLACNIVNPCGLTPPTYSWAPASGLSSTSISNPTATPTISTTYTCYVTGGQQGCWIANDTVAITTSPASNANAGNPVSICIGSNTTLNATGGGTYSWAPATGLSATNVSNPIAAPTTTTTFTVTVTQGLCSSSATVVVTVNPLPAVNFTGIDTVGCAPLVVTFTNNTPNSINCNWLFGGTGTSNSCGNPVVFTYTTPGVYSVTLVVTDNNGCIASTSHPNMVTVYPKPVSCFMLGPQPTTILEPEITFTDCSIGATNWFWSFGDALNTTSVLQSPRFTYVDTGMFNVQQIVCNANGCCDTSSQTLMIGPYFSIYVPNAFSPNNDFKNNEFYPVGTGMDKNTYHMWIYDRWGNLIYDTNDWNNGHWTGKTKNGKKMEEDVYVWYIKIEDYMHQSYEYVGHVSLIR